MKIDAKYYLIGGGLLTLLVMMLFLQRFTIFLAITLLTIMTALLLRFVKILKYLGIELVTFSTIIVGSMFHNPFVGAVYAFTILIIHLTLGDYYIGAYVAWVIPVYITLGVMSGIIGTGMSGTIGIAVVIGINVVNGLFTLMAESDRFGKELPYAIGNTILNLILLTQLFTHIMNWIS